MFSRIFFRVSGEERGRAPAHEHLWLVGGVFNLAIGSVLAVVICCVVYPTLSLVLWCRGFGGIFVYAQRLRGSKTPWERRQINLGEEGEWNVARRHAIQRNARCAVRAVEY